MGRDKQGVFRPLYNVQIIDDLDSPFILSYGVFAQTNDAGLLGAMLQRHQRLVGRLPKELLADSAYAGGPDLAVADAAAVTMYAPWQSNDYSTAAAGVAKQLPKSAFLWQAELGTYVCPQGHVLVYEKQSREWRATSEPVTVFTYRCPAEHCRACPLAAQSRTAAGEGRTVTRSEHEELLEALRARMATPEAKALYRLRRQTVELVNADGKEHRGLRRLSGRGLRRAETPVGLCVLAHNLLTLQSERGKASDAKATAQAATPLKPGQDTT